MRLYLAATLTALSLAGMAAAEGPHDVFGTYATEAGTSHVQISDCGDGTPCGTIIWIDPASLPEGETPETVIGDNGENVLGQQILEGFAQKTKDWRGGTVYDPENDKTYAARIKRLDSGALQLKGCIGPICQTQVWPEIAAEDAR